jgi:hypothetical protein
MKKNRSSDKPRSVTLSALLVVVSCGSQAPPRIPGIPCGNGPYTTIDFCNPCSDDEMKDASMAKCCFNPKPGSGVATCDGATFSRAKSCCPPGDSTDS